MCVCFAADCIAVNRANQSHNESDNEKANPDVVEDHTVNLMASAIQQEGVKIHYQHQVVICVEAFGNQVDITTFAA